MRRAAFARGLADIRAGKYNPTLMDADDEFWAYERGRLLGAIMPTHWPLYIGRRLNPSAVELFWRASAREEIG